MRSIVICLLLACGNASAQIAGTSVLQVGVFHVNPLDSSKPLRTELRPSLLGSVLGIDETFTSPGTSAAVSSTETLALTYSRFLTDHLAIKFEGGVPASFELSGEGIVAPTGISGALFNVDLGDPANNPLAEARQWSPALLLQYFFGEPEAMLRPFIGLGVTYTWFTDVKLKPAFSDDVNQQFGRVLALATGAPGPTSADADSSSSWAPIINLGVAYAFDRRWGLSGSFSYSTIQTTAKIDVTAADGTRLATSRTDLDVNPIVAAVFVNYAF